MKNLTKSLYEERVRIGQEMLLGIMGSNYAHIESDVYHLNEGHAAYHSESD